MAVSLIRSLRAASSSPTARLHFLGHRRHRVPVVGRAWDCGDRRGYDEGLGDIMNDMHKCWNCGSRCGCGDDGVDDCLYCDVCNEDLYGEDFEDYK